MKILHTSDWHLGKRLMKLDRSEEHTAFLNWLVDALKSEKIDLLLIAGDIFDVPNPPHQSLELFYHFLHRVSVETKTETLIIAGNHDSGILLDAPKELLRTHRVKVWGKLSQNPADHWITLHDKLDVCAIPFFRSFELMPEGEGDAIEALKKYFQREKTKPTLLLFHHLAGIYEAAGSEQVVSLSGVDSLPLDLLKDFDYVALGHIHKPQKISEKAYYSGSPIPLRFSETAEKSVLILELKEKNFDIRKLSVPVLRPMHLVKATLENWKEKLNALPESEGLTPVVEIQLTLKSPQVGISDEIREVLTKKGMELLSFIPFYEAADEKPKRKENLFELSPTDLFSDYFSFRFPNETLSEEVKEDFKALLIKVKDAAP
ncbi:MAG: exonuclease SbcCD subunit D [Bacteriovoracaceae bacterium]